MIPTAQTLREKLDYLVRATGRFTKAELHALLDQLFDGSTLYLSKGFRAHGRNLLDDF